MAPTLNRVRGGTDATEPAKQADREKVDTNDPHPRPHAIDSTPSAEANWASAPVLSEVAGGERLLGLAQLRLPAQPHTRGQGRLITDRSDHERANAPGTAGLGERAGAAVAATYRRVDAGGTARRCASHLACKPLLHAIGSPSPPGPGKEHTMPMYKLVTEDGTWLADERLNGFDWRAGDKIHRGPGDTL